MNKEQIIENIIDEYMEWTWEDYSVTLRIILEKHLQDLESLKEEKKECSHNMTYETNSYIRKCCQCWKIIE